MIIDCHYHYERRLLTDQALLNRMDRCGVEQVALMAVLTDPIPMPSEFLLKVLRFCLTHRFFRPAAKMLAANFTPQGDLKIPSGIVFIIEDPSNDPIFQAVEARPDRFLGWVFVNPRGTTDPLNEFNRWKDTPGFIGIKAHPFWHRYPPAELIPVAAELAKTGKPLLIHAGFDAHGDFGALLREVPELKLILAHAGFPYYADTWKAIKDNSNVYVDLSQTSYMNETTTRQAVASLGVDRCLFGTDGPYGVHGDDDLFDYGFLKRRIEHLFPDRGVQKRILGENFMELTGLN